MKCNICNSENTIIKNYEHIYLVKGKEIKLNTQRRFCKNCNNLIYDEELDQLASKQIIEAYNKKYGIPSDTIIELRKKYNLSIEKLSKIIGCAKKTLISYEKGLSIPNDCYLIILKTLINNPSTIKEFLEVTKNSFTEKEYNSINKNINKFLDNNIKQIISNSDFEPTEYNGYTKLDINKIYNMILIFTNKCVLKTKLLKEMFYSDFIFYKKTGMSITGLEYAKLPHGPVPDQFEQIICECILKGYIIDDVKYKNNYEFHNIKGIKSLNKDIFTKEEYDVICNVKEYFKDYDCSQIEKKSHLEKAYKDTKDNAKISYCYSFDIDINI